MAVYGKPTITCCKGCTERYEACWGSCEKYLKQKAEYDAQKAEARKRLDVISGLNEARCDTIYKTTKWRTYRGKYRKGH